MDFPFVSESQAQTIAWGKEFARELSPGDVVALKGELGSGKTHLAKGIAEGLGVNRNRVTSPTFSLIHEYSGRLPLYHFDCYRIESLREALEIGAEEYFYGTGICLVEWPERIASILPLNTIWIEINSLGGQERQFNMKQKG